MRDSVDGAADRASGHAPCAVPPAPARDAGSRCPPYLRVVAEAEDGKEAIQQAEEVIPDVVLMDVRMPRMSGIEATRVIVESVPTAKVLMLTVSDGLLLVWHR